MNSVGTDTTIRRNTGDGKQLYWLGLLGFIPLLGAAIGLVLILLGIYRYANRTLAYIGTACILFTVAVYSVLFYVADTSNELSLAFVTVTQVQVNGLVKEIEFYKSQHGVYPDDLEDLQGEGGMVSIEDPILVYHAAEGNINIRYRRVGSGYELYSVGVDVTDGTADDIYPSLAVYDSTKIGLVRRNRTVQ